MRTFAALAACGVLVGAQTTLPSGPPMGVYRSEEWQPAVTATTVALKPTAAAINKRDAACIAQPTGISYNTSPDTAEAFLADSYYPNSALSAITPSGFTQVFENLTASNYADNYLGFTLLDTYDVATCGSKCAEISGCNSFNIYYERDPSVAPDDVSCPNPASVVNIKCIWYGSIVSSSNANNYGLWRSQFQVVIAGSNGYVNNAASTSTASSNAPASTSVTGSNGSTYNIYYSSDSTTGSFTNAAASSSYTDCMSACDAITNCQAFTYVGADAGAGSGTCWLKTSLGSATSAPSGYVSGAKISGGSSSSVASSAISGVPSTSVAASATSSVSSMSVASSAISSAPSTSVPSSATSIVPSTSVASSATSSVSSTSVASSAILSVSSTSVASSATSSISSSSIIRSSIATTSSIASSATSVSSKATTLATIVKTSSSSVLASSTSTSASATASSFYIKIGGTGTSADGKYAVVVPSQGGRVGFVSWTPAASKFTIDANKNLIEMNPTFGYAANVARGTGSYQRLYFGPLGNSVSYTSCSIQNPYVVCNANGNFNNAAVCAIDGYSSLIFGVGQIPSGCTWAALLPVSV